MADLYRLTRGWFDANSKYHPKGTEILLDKKEAPASAKLIGKEEKADIEANADAAEDPLLTEPEIDIGDVKAGDTLSSITKKAKK